ncbi:MAG: NHL repeat-containing protein, partial [Desulfuromonadaceae bacterium]
IPGAVNFIPRRVAVNRDGLIYVASQHRGVLVLDAEGNFLRWLQPKDQLSKRALAAAALQESSKDDEASEEPVVSTGDIPEEFRPAGEGERGLTPVQIRGVTIDSQGQIYLVSSETGKIYVYNAEETFLFSFGTKGGTPGRLSQPRGVAVDPVGKRMNVSDYMRHTILVYDEKGEFLFEFGGKGDAPGWFKFPTDVVVDRRGQVIVSDLFNHRLQVFEIQQWKEAPSLEHLLELAAPDAAAEQQVESAGDSEEAATPESSDEATEAVEPEITEEVLPEQDISSYPDQPAQ